MNNTLKLPEGYTELYHLDLQRDKKPALLVNGLSLLLALVLLIPALLAVPMTVTFDFSQGAGAALLRGGTLLIALFLYVLLHEWVHGICMKHFSGKKAHYGFTGLYAYAGSDAYFTRRSYLIIALAPVALWGAVLLAINCMVDASWFWVVYFLQVMNLSGAAGDLYVTYKFSQMPREILVQDTGVAMTVYAPRKDA